MRTEELIGDDSWHVAAFKVEGLEDDQLAASQAPMRELAARLGGEYKRLRT